MAKATWDDYISKTAVIDRHSCHAGHHWCGLHQHLGLLRRWHHAGHRAGGSGRSRRKASKPAPPSSPACWTSPTPACLDVFIDEAFVKYREAEMGKGAG